MSKSTRTLLHRALAALALFCALAALAGPLAAQGRPTADSAKVAELEDRVRSLERQVAALSERLEALLATGNDVKVQDVPVGPSPVRGNPNAPITLVMFGDYQSDYTARAQYVVKRLLAAYPQQLRFVYKHYPLTQMHPLASEAALAALAAERQGRFWEYHDLLFQNSRRLDGPLLLVLAEKVGLDLSRFERDRRSLDVLQRLSDDEKLATNLGIVGLPTLFLNGRLMAAWHYDYLTAQIDKLKH